MPAKSIHNEAGRILLAPMEGVVDATMRDLLTRIGQFDRCVTEFVRVTHTLLPRRVFKRFCPELEHDSRTPSGTPVYLQLLGGQADLMAQNARRAADLGCAGIDLNFGCPAKTVNRHEGGSILLNEPERVRNLVESVRNAVPINIPVSVKIRLGVEDTAQFEDICRGIQSAGATELCIHARTKVQGYKPPAYWSDIRRVKDRVKIPLIVNGEIWTKEDADLARIQSGCRDIMLGRGAIACPDLSRQIHSHWYADEYQPMAWLNVLELLQYSFNANIHVHQKHIGNRLKQWLVYLKRHYPEAEALFTQIKPLRDIDLINKAIEQCACKAA